MENKPVLNRREVKRQKTAKTIKGAAARIVIMTAVLLIACFAVMGINRLTDYIHEKDYRALGDEEIAYALVRGEEKEAENADASSEKRLELARAACSIVGKVNYFWGGKSSAAGVDPAWGELREVTSSGSESSGQMKPYGLDCSGFVSWAFIQLGYSFSEMETLLGNGTWNQWDRSAENRCLRIARQATITWSLPRAARRSTTPEGRTYSIDRGCISPLQILA